MQLCQRYYILPREQSAAARPSVVAVLHSFHSFANNPQPAATSTPPPRVTQIIATLSFGRNMKIRRKDVGGNQGRSSSCPGCGNSPKGIPIITIIILLVLFGLMLPSTFHVFMIHPDTNSDHVLRSSINNESNLDANHEVKGGPKAIDWSNPFEPGEEERFSCDWTTFESISSHRREPMCVHSFPDIVSQFVKDDKRWRDCNNLPTIWNATLNVNSNGASTNQNEKRVYVDIGANIGSCVMEMLLGTDADIIAFEPHPMNLFNIKKTISKLGEWNFHSFSMLQTLLILGWFWVC